ncbi:uncharacterized protein LOC121861434 [Homarus americanus]|uniref:Uncharacterized protein n=1 Tax=Homarus americanus TaxID=6706 RepID=A0A8J5NBF7_HOMAM|nr:uncharacterized protein LOC121861434 [Homarus americanus]KAG7177606.1 hypothetical protein Hamer_G008250 [Homarus americanus]
MSKPDGPQIKAPKPSIPEGYRSGPTGHVSQGVNRYKLNLEDRTDSRTHKFSPGTYQGQKQRKVGRVQVWIQRNPLKFQVITIGVGLGIFFSRFLYDALIKEGKQGPRAKVERGYSF